MKKRSVLAIKESFAEMDQRLVQAEADLKTVRAFTRQLKKITANMEAMQSFYHAEAWLTEREIVHQHLKEGEYFLSAAEDPIWNAAEDLRQAKLQLLKQIVKGL